MKRVFLFLLSVFFASTAAADDTSLFYDDPGGGGWTALATSSLDMDGYDITLDQDGDTAITNDRDAGVADDAIGITTGGALNFQVTHDGTGSAILFGDTWDGDHTYLRGTNGSITVLRGDGLAYDNFYAGSLFTSDSDTNLSAAGLGLDAADIIDWATGATISSPTDGNLLVTDDAGTDFGLLQLGGTTSSYPALKRSSTTVEIRFADDSAYGNLDAGQIEHNYIYPSIALQTGNIKNFANTQIMWNASTSTWTASPDLRIDRNSAGNLGILHGSKFPETIIAAITESVTFAADPGDATKTTTGSILPDGAWVLQVTGRVVTAGTNCSSFDVGDGVDPDLFADNISVADTTTFTSADATANWSNPQTSAGEITVTGVGGNCFDLVVALTVHYISSSAATAD